jgi:methionyl aminopeptidase
MQVATNPGGARVAIIIKTQNEIAMLREAGRINAMALDAMRRALCPGITTAELDAIAEDVIRSHNAIPAFLNYPNPNRKHADCPYPATITASINDELVHGIPGPRALKAGDIISLDCGCVFKGFVGDAAFTAGIGTITEQAALLLKVTEESLYLAIDASRVGNRLGDVSAVIQEHAERHGFNVVREYTGHGVGRDMHEDPQIPNWGWRGDGIPIRAGMTYALEPMVMVGEFEVYVKPDTWTVATKDRSLCAHFEHTIAVTDGDPLILTLL